MRETEGFNSSFEKLMVFGVAESGGVRITEWKDIPVELLLRILSLVDDQSVIVASGVCHGWRDAISWGLTHLSLSWYIDIFSLHFFIRIKDSVFCFLDDVFLVGFAQVWNE